MLEMKEVGIYFAVVWGWRGSYKSSEHFAWNLNVFYAEKRNSWKLNAATTYLYIRGCYSMMWTFGDESEENKDVH